MADPGTTDAYVLLEGDCRIVLGTIQDQSIDAIVTDPPYELGFMGKRWDASGIAYDAEVWAQCLRVLKPGGHLLAFGGTRTYHRMAVAIEDAGFEIRDSIHWLYGSGFPKSLDVSKAIDKAAGAERKVVGTKKTNVGIQGGNFSAGSKTAEVPVTTAATDAARQWEGWGTALKPAHEPIVVARKPLSGTVAANVLEHGTGALNIDGCRIAATDGYEKAWDRPVSTNIGAGGNGNYISDGSQHTIDISANKPMAGRWPANIVIDEMMARRHPEWSHYFYVAKPDEHERNAGGDNKHPTVKPVALMRWLVRLVTPPGGTILDPFAGSGTTLVAAILEERHPIGIELTDEYHSIIHHRCQKTANNLQRILF